MILDTFEESFSFACEHNKLYIPLNYYSNYGSYSAVKEYVETVSSLGFNDLDCIVFSFNEQDAFIIHRATYGYRKYSENPSLEMSNERDMSVTLLINYISYKYNKSVFGVAAKLDKAYDELQFLLMLNEQGSK
jgi:hypothetical protein